MAKSPAVTVWAACFSIITDYSEIGIVGSNNAASVISGGLSIAADKGISHLRLSSIVLATCSSAEYFYLTGFSGSCQ